jgi:hypothetical protein
LPDRLPQFYFWWFNNCDSRDYQSRLLCTPLKLSSRASLLSTDPSWTILTTSSQDLASSVSTKILIDTGLSVVQFGLALYLLLVSGQESVPGCSWPPWGILVSSSSYSRMLPRPGQWQKYALLLCSSLLLDVFVVVSALWLSFYNAQGRRVVNALHDPVMSILLSFWFTTTLEELVGQVDNMTEPVAESWPIGQISAILGLIAVAIEVWEYVKGKGPTNTTTPRYQRWWSESKTLFATV